MLKVGRKRKRKETQERKKEKKHKLDCLDLSSHFSASCLKRLHHAAKETKYKIGSISEYHVTIKQATHRLKKKHFSRGFIKIG